MKRRIYFPILLCMVLWLTGCADKNLYVTSFEERYLCSVGDCSATVGEYNMLLLDVQRQYEAYYSEILGDNIWERKVDENRTFADYVQKDIVLDELVILELLQIEAANLQITLMEEELAQIAEAADAYMSQLNAETVEYTHTSREQTAELMEKYILAQKVIDYYSAHTDLEVSENEARTIQIQTITLPEKETIEQIIAELEGGEEFIAAVQKYTDTAAKEYTVVRGELKTELEEDVFLLKTGECSESIETEDGFCLIYCQDDYLKEQTERNRQTIVRQRIYDAWYSVVGELRTEQPLMINENQWSKIRMAEDEAITGGFFEVYNEWFTAVELRRPQ